MLPEDARPWVDVVFGGPLALASPEEQVIREAGSKMPADLGGDIYGSLPDRADILPIERTIEAFMGAI